MSIISYFASIILRSFKNLSSLPLGGPLCAFVNTVPLLKLDGFMWRHSLFFFLFLNNCFKILHFLLLPWHQQIYIEVDIHVYCLWNNHNLCVSDSFQHIPFILCEIISLKLWDWSSPLPLAIKKWTWPLHCFSNKRIQPPVQRKQCECAESSCPTDSFCGRWLSKSEAPSSEQPLMLGDHALREDGQARPVWGPAVCSSRRARLCNHGEICQHHTGLERSNGLLACGGGLYRLRDLCDPAGVGSSEVYDPEGAEVHQRDHTMVSSLPLCLHELHEVFQRISDERNHYKRIKFLVKVTILQKWWKNRDQM